MSQKNNKKRPAKKRKLVKNIDKKRQTAQPQEIVIKQKGARTKTILILITIALIAIFTFGIVSTIAFKMPEVMAWMFPESSVVRDSLDDNIPGAANGGLTIEEIEQFREIDTKPYADDVFRNFYIKELPNYVVVYREIVQPNGAKIYPNLLFVKQVRNGETVLIWDGAVGVKAKVPFKNWWDQLRGVHNFSAAKVELSLNLESGYNRNDPAWWQNIYGIAALFKLNLINTTENIVTFSDFKVHFAENFWNTNAIAALAQKNTEEDKLYNFIRNYLIQNVMFPNFMHLTDKLEGGTVELIHGSDNNPNAPENLQILSSYVTHLWNQSKTSDKSDNNALVDLSNYFDTYINEDLQANYPMSEELTQQFGFENYRIYENTVYANTFYTYENTKISRDTNKIKDNTAPFVIAPTPEVTKFYTLVNIKLNNVNNSNLTNFNITQEPVTITFGSKKVVINTVNKLADGVNIALETNLQINYTLTSEGLIFDSYTGSFTPVGTQIVKIFDFTYLYNHVSVAVRLNNLSGVNTSQLDLAAHPVTVVFSNSMATHQFLFNSNAKLTQTLTQIMSKGTYNYTILPGQLIFSTKSGTFEINATNRVFIFNYAVDESVDDYVLTLTGTGSANVPSPQSPLVIDFTNAIHSLGEGEQHFSVQIFNSDYTQLVSSQHVFMNHDTLAKSAYIGSHSLFSQGATYKIIVSYITSSGSYNSNALNYTYNGQSSYISTYSLNIQVNT